jgi:uncharacterized protein (TIGR02996 family)
VFPPGQRTVTTEDDFQAMLSANPDDHATRLILADFLDDHGDPRGPGYRGLALQRRLPVEPGRPSQFIHPGYCNAVGARRVVGGDARVEAAAAVLPKDWFAATKKQLGAADPLQDAYWACGDTRRDAEDAAAAAFAALAPARRAKLLGLPPAAKKGKARGRPGTAVPRQPPGAAWTPAELALLDKLTDAEVAARTGRSVAAVRSKRRRQAGP